MESTVTHGISEQEASQYRSEFPIFEHTVYLNSCSLGPLSARTIAALDRYRDAWSAYGAPAWWQEWLPQLDTAKQRFAQLIGAAQHEVTISHSVSSALSSVASALDYRERCAVVCANLDFPTISHQWLAKARQGVTVRFAQASDGVRVSMSEYESHMSADVAAIATSHVFYATGYIQPIRKLADLAHSHGAKLIVDGYHSVGVLPVDVKALDVDIYIGGVLKWLLGGPGLTFIYVREGLLEELTPSITGWFAGSNQFAFDSLHLDLARTADRFELGTPAVATAYTGTAGMDMILEAEPSRIWTRLQNLTERIVTRAKAEGFGIMSPDDPSERGGVVMLQLRQPQETVHQLASRGFTVDYRPGLVRVSPHFFNTAEDVDRLMREIAIIQQQMA